VNDVRSLAADERDELEQAAEIAPRAQRAPDMLERDCARPRSSRSLQQRAGTVRGDDDVEMLDEGGEQRGHVRLSSAGLGERDDHQDPGALSHSPPREGNPTTLKARALLPRAAPLAIGLVTVAVFLAWAVLEGGYAPTTWYPGAFVFLVLAGGRDDVAAVLARADVFVLSSTSEGLPLSILEAMAAGLPVVASSVGGVPEAVEDGATGLLVPPRDPVRLAAALERLLVDPALRRRLGSNGRERVREHFGLEAFQQAHVAVYRRALARRDGTRSP